MTWRRFVVLLRNLGPNSLYVNALLHEERRRRDQPRILEGEEAEHAFRTMFK